MPFLRLTLNPATAEAAVDTELARDLCFGLRDLMVTILGKKSELTSVLIEAPSALTWTIGAAEPEHAVHLEVTITEGTNTTDQKEEFIVAAMALLKRRFGRLHEATYIVVAEAPASDWGYDGRTQAARRDLMSAEAQSAHRSYP